MFHCSSSSSHFILLFVIVATWIAILAEGSQQRGFLPVATVATPNYPYWKTTTNAHSSNTYLQSRKSYELETDDGHKEWARQQQAQLCMSKTIARSLVDGAVLRVASDLTLGTPLESIKCRVTGTLNGPFEATKNIIQEGGIWALWAGTPSRTIEGALLGAVFMLGSTLTKQRVRAMGCGPTLTALAGGLVGGVAQSVVMTPAGMVFTSLNLNRGKPGYENDNAWTVTKRIVKEKGLGGMYFGIGPMAARQASNWASRAGFTEICRSTLKLSKYGVWGEIGSGCIGGIGSCWNTPIETIRVIMQGDVSAGRPPKSFMGYWDDMVEEQGYPGLFRGVTPRGIQAIWQTVFMVVVPNMMGL